MKYVKRDNLALHSNIALGVLLLSLAGAAEGQKAARDLTEASLEDLMNIEVTTVSKKVQKLSEAPAAVFVITQEDIRRSGMTTIPDLLRMVPGLQVGQMQGGTWAVSARGFNSQASDKMLVMVDGRSIYSPLSKGVSWDQQDILLEDIERIEVVRGPGATLWGANAVNGVVNIITKSAADTQGNLVTAGAGPGGQVLGGLRFGGSLGDSGHYRVFSKYSEGNDLSSAQMSLAGTTSLHSGLRADWTLSSRDTLTVEGDLFHADSGSAFGVLQLTPPFVNVVGVTSRDAGGDLMANWSQRQSDRSNTELRVYVDHSAGNDLLENTSVSTIDVDFQQQLTLSESNGLVWGLGFRDSSEHQDSKSFNLVFLPPNREDRLFSAFVQDQWKIVGDQLSLIVGSKFEHNKFSGFNLQPSARLLWTPDARHTVWAGVSRALRTPAYTDQSIQINLAVEPGPQGLPALVTVFGSPEYKPESLLAYELGYRLQAARRFSVDIATYINSYHHLVTLEPGNPFFSTDPQPAHLVIPLTFGNEQHGTAYGGEISSNLNLTAHWRLIPSYSLLQLNLRNDPTSHDTNGLTSQTQSPRHQYQIRSNLDLSRRFQFDAAAYYTAGEPGLSIRAYTRLDARLGYRPRPDFEISLAGQNLQGGRHQELISFGPYLATTIGRSLMVRVTWGF
jgi:iron complex outermembrane recepter protein